MSESQHTRHRRRELRTQFDEEAMDIEEVEMAVMQETLSNNNPAPAEDRPFGLDAEMGDDTEIERGEIPQDDLGNVLMTGQGHEESSGNWNVCLKCEKPTSIISETV